MASEVAPGLACSAHTSNETLLRPHCSNSNEGRNENSYFFLSSSSSLLPLSRPEPGKKISSPPGETRQLTSVPSVERIETFARLDLNRNFDQSISSRLIRRLVEKKRNSPRLVIQKFLVLSFLALPRSVTNDAVLSRGLKSTEAELTRGRERRAGCTRRNIFFAIFHALIATSVPRDRRLTFALKSKLVVPDMGQFENEQLLYSEFFLHFISRRACIFQNCILNSLGCLYFIS